VSARRWIQGLVIATCSTVAVAPALAQAQPPASRTAGTAAAAAKVDPQEAARYQIAVMESVLETAVQRGAQIMTRQWRAVAPDMLLMSGTARARGFKLDGYGVFFVVDVPAMRQSVVWTWRMLDREAGGTDVALQTLRDMAKSVADPVKRKEVEQAVRRIEIQVAPYSRTADPNGPPVVGAAAAPGSRPVTPASAAGAPAEAAAAALPDAMTDPGEAYTNAVKNALVDAMLDYSQALSVAPDESVTVAARDNAARALGNDDAGESVTIMIRLKGSDLQAFRTGRINREEVRKRVEIREF